MPTKNACASRWTLSSGRPAQLFSPVGTKGITIRHDIALRLPPPRKPYPASAAITSVSRAAPNWGKRRFVLVRPPKLVFVLIRVGRTEDGFEVARRASRLFRGAETWWAAGIACALERKAEEVRRRLPSLERERDKVILEAGVSLGLQEQAEKGANKPDR